MTTKTLQGALREFGVRVVPISQAYHRGARQTCAGRTLELVFRTHGFDNLRATLMTFTETAAPNKRALISPVILAVSDVIRAYPDWFGPVWLEAFDSIDLGQLFLQASANRRIAQPRQMIATLLFDRLRPHFPDVKMARRRPLPTAPELAEAA
jgi:hypothetical protein